VEHIVAVQDRYPLAVLFFLRKTAFEKRWVVSHEHLLSRLYFRFTLHRILFEFGFGFIALQHLNLTRILFKLVLQCNYLDLRFFTVIIAIRSGKGIDTLAASI
jgi:hypothetical protein